jgi:hypothetical protein
MDTFEYKEQPRPIDGQPHLLAYMSTNSLVSKAVWYQNMVQLSLKLK